MCGSAVLPTENFRSPPFRDSIDAEKVLYFTKKVCLHIGIVSYAAEAWVAGHTSKDSFVLHSVIKYLQETDRTDTADTSRESRVVPQHKDVKRIAVCIGSLRYEAEVSGIVNREMNRLDGMKSLRASVVLRDSAACSFDDCGNDVRCVVA